LESPCDFVASSPGEIPTTCADGRGGQRASEVQVLGRVGFGGKNAGGAQDEGVS